jgi:hypothetical protein
MNTARLITLTTVDDEQPIGRWLIHNEITKNQALDDVFTMLEFGMVCPLCGSGGIDRDGTIFCISCGRRLLSRSDINLFEEVVTISPSLADRIERARMVYVNEDIVLELRSGNL